jgi:hypothetical protein
MSTQYRLVQTEKTASGGCSAGQGSLEPVAPRIFYFTVRTMQNQYIKYAALLTVKAYGSYNYRSALKG